MSDHETINATDEPHGTESTETPEVPAGGTAAGAPVSGAEITEEAAEDAVEPDDANRNYEVDGPQAGHA